MTNFADRFDSYYSQIQNQRSYDEAKGYYEDNGTTRWEPVHEVDEEPLEPAFGPGAMRRGELDDFDISLDCDEFFSGNDEPDLYADAI